mgnify:CR=1 FL=1
MVRFIEDAKSVPWQYLFFRGFTIFILINFYLFLKEGKSFIKNYKNIKKNDLIFWKGHVAMCLNSKQLVHAYGPEKKVVIMPIIETINRIQKTAKLKVKKISRINY